MPRLYAVLLLLAKLKLLPFMPLILFSSYVAYPVAAHSANVVAVLSANAVAFHLGYAGAGRFFRCCCHS